MVALIPDGRHTQRIRGSTSTTGALEAKDEADEKEVDEEEYADETEGEEEGEEKTGSSAMHRRKRLSLCRSSGCSST